MKTGIKFWFCPIAIIGMLLALTNSCKKDDNDNNNNKGIVTDIDGNVYHTVTIGTQVWLVENLKVTKYRNGDPIPSITGNSAWYNLTTCAYCIYEDNISIANTYGYLYNWYAVNDNRKIAPMGWHIPTDEEWTTLITYLGGDSVAGGKLKEAGTTHWHSPNEGATNMTGFKALPGGYRLGGGSFTLIEGGGYWWSATEEDANYAKGLEMLYGYKSVFSYIGPKGFGLSVRCIKD
jgi:uncharacterized protein (TIGR02145 family)